MGAVAERFGHFLLVAMLPSIAVPSFDGQGEFPPSYAIEVGLRGKVAGHEPGKRAPASVLQIGRVPPVLRDYFGRTWCVFGISEKLPSPNDVPN